MEKSRVIAFLIAAVLLVFLLVAKPFERETVIPDEEFEEVFVAVGNVDGKKIVKAEDLEAKKVHKSLVPSSSIRKQENIVGKAAIANIYPGDVFTEEKLSTVGSDEIGLTLMVPDGMRAITLEVEIDTGLGGLLKVANKVDVISVLAISDTEEIAKLVLQNREVLALDKNINNKGEETENSYVAVTLAVTPEEASKLTLAENRAKKTRIILRNQEDDKNSNVRNIGIPDIIN